jgi:hypothetical protein
VKREAGRGGYAQSILSHMYENKTTKPVKFVTRRERE